MDALEGRAARAARARAPSRSPGATSASGSITTTEPHNLALQFLAETGIVGFLLLLGFDRQRERAAAVCALRRRSRRAGARPAALAHRARRLRPARAGRHRLGVRRRHRTGVLRARGAASASARVAGAVSRPVSRRCRSRGLGVLYSLVAPYASSRLVDSAYSRARRRPDAGSALRRTRGPLAEPALDRPAACARRRRGGAARRGGRAPLLPRRRSTSSRRTRAPGTRSARTSSSPGATSDALHDLDRAYGLDPYGPGRAPGRPARPGAGEGARPAS